MLFNSLKRHCKVLHSIVIRTIEITLNSLQTFLNICTSVQSLTIDAILCLSSYEGGLIPEFKVKELNMDCIVDSAFAYSFLKAVYESSSLTYLSLDIAYCQ